ncbi:unnamed protein product, partial [Discosporangium mesarthrocarpum]
LRSLPSGPTSRLRVLSSLNTASSTRTGESDSRGLSSRGGGYEGVVESNSRSSRRRESISQFNNGGGTYSKRGSTSGSASAPSSKRRREMGEHGDAYFEYTEELMEKDLPSRMWSTFAMVIFELGLKNSSPKVCGPLLSMQGEADPQPDPHVPPWMFLETLTLSQGKM